MPALHPTTTMKPFRISELNAAQVEAVFKSDRFSLLTDSQLVALHHRSEQLQALAHQQRLKRRRRRLLAAAVAIGGVALAPYWVQVFTAFALMLVIVLWGLIWFGAITALWNLVSRLWRALIGSKPLP
jgi:hypothetical protein